MTPHSSTLSWQIPWMEEPGGLQSMGSLKVGHDWVSSLSLSCIGEGNGNPLQCSCLENPRDWGAWWAAVCAVAQIRTRLKQLSSSSLYVVLIGLLLDCTLLWLAHSSLYFVLIGWLLAQFSLIGWLKACWGGLNWLSLAFILVGFAVPYPVVCSYWLTPSLYLALMV